MKYDSNNLFARMARGDIPVERVYEDDEVFAIRDIAPAAPLHLLVMPKGEFTSFDDFARKATPALIAHFFAVIARLASQEGIDQTGYRLIANHGAHAAQTVPHFHMHLLGGKPLGGLLAGDGLER